MTSLPTQDAAAFGETRTLSFFHTHTRESLTVTFRRNGQVDEGALSQLNWFLRDWRVEKPAQMDPRLFDILWEVYRESGSSQPINIISAYRSPETNGALRRRSSGVAEHSQHMLGKAMDIRLPDVETGRLRAIAMKMQYGGVGYYASSAFVHVDTGNVRAWPRMTQQQLVQLFPDGKTLHLPVERQAAVRIRAGEGGNPGPQRRHGYAGLGRRRPVHRRIVRQSLRPQECRAGAGNGEAEHRDDGGLRRSGEHPGHRSGRSASAAAAARDSACQRACA